MKLIVGVVVERCSMVDRVVSVSFEMFNVELSGIGNVVVVSIVTSAFVVEVISVTRVVGNVMTGDNRL